MSEQGAGSNWRDLSISRNERAIILASSLGTAFEWYDFFLYGSLAAQIGKAFSAGLDETAGFLFALAAFAVGFLVRPFGALVFGRIGDLIGRKNTFLLTIVIMGATTFGVGLLPGFAVLGVAAPVLLIILRMFQGLALGGEFGGAVIYVAEHSPTNKRAYYCSWVISTATIGLILSLLVIVICRRVMSPEQFDVWGWRVPFLFSIILLAISVWIRLKLQESPVFLKMKAEGARSRAPLSDSFTKPKNLRLVLIALFGMTIGGTVSWYTAQIYIRVFLTNVLKVDGAIADITVSAALILSSPAYILFGWLSDRLGRKRLFISGLAVAAAACFPIFSALTHFANPDLEAAMAAHRVVVVADPADCSFQFDPVGKIKYVSSCDIAKRSLSNRGVPYVNQPAAPGSVAMIEVGDSRVSSYDGSKPAAAAEFNTALSTALASAGYPVKADLAKYNGPMVFLLTWLLMVIAAICYVTSTTATLELFPANIRYTSFSFPYHFGSGWWGGLLPVTVTAVVVQTGNIYAGLWYPVGFALTTMIIGALFVPETKNIDMGA